jgi:hypothetical protein
MGRFTLRDEGKTIAVGKVLKYKPYSKGIVGTQQKKDVNAVAKKLAETSISKPVAEVEELVYDMDTGELAPKKKNMDAIAEDEEDNE